MSVGPHLLCSPCHPPDRGEEFGQVSFFLASVETCGGPGSPRGSISQALEMTRVHENQTKLSDGKEIPCIGNSEYVKQLGLKLHTFHFLLL